MGTGCAGPAHPGFDPAGQLVHRHGPGPVHRAGGGRSDQRVLQHQRAARLGQPVLEPGPRVRAGLEHCDRRLRGAVRGLDLQPAHGRRAVPAGLLRHGRPRRLLERGVLPAVRDVRPGHAADPDRTGGRAAVPGGPVQHRRPEPVHRRRNRGHLLRVRGQPAAGDPRDRLRARRFRRRSGDRLGGRRAQGPDRRARGDRHHHAQLHHGLLPVLPAGLPLPDAGARDGQPDHLGHRRGRAPAAAVRHAPAHQRRAS